MLFGFQLFRWENCYAIGNAALRSLNLASARKAVVPIPSKTFSSRLSLLIDSGTRPMIVSAASLDLSVGEPHEIAKNKKDSISSIVSIAGMRAICFWL
jgi:hypothetical protein